LTDRAVEVIAAPFHAATPRQGMGAGPVALLAGDALLGGQSGVAERAGFIDEAGLHGDELGRILEICARVAARTAAALHAGRAVLLLTGNCNHAHLAAAAALAPRTGADRLGVVWMDAHADFDTPQNTRSSFFDGMGLTVLTGQAYGHLAAARIPGFAPLAESHVVMVGVRDLEPYQRDRLQRSDVRAIAPSELAGVDEALAELASHVDAVYLHLDLDGIDPSFGRANEYAAAGGLAVEQVLGLIDDVVAAAPVPVAAVTAYNPEVDPDGTMLETARTVITHLAQALARP
jgi:arginase